MIKTAVLLDIEGRDGSTTINLEDKNPTLSGDLIVIFGQEIFNISGWLNVSVTVYFVAGD